jgi:hypothetical protein
VALNNQFFMSRKGMNLSAAHNAMAQQMLELSDQYHRDAVVWLEHDHTFDYPNVFAYLERLDLERYPIVGLLYVERSEPNLPVGFDKVDGEYIRWTERMDDFMEHPGLHEVSGGVPMGVTIISRKVFERLAELDPLMPWYQAPAELRGEMTDDIFFCQRAMEAGFPVHVETRFHIRHWGSIGWGVEHFFAGRELQRPKLDILTEELVARRYQAPEGEAVTA